MGNLQLEARPYSTTMYSYDGINTARMCTATTASTQHDDVQLWAASTRHDGRHQTRVWVLHPIVPLPLERSRSGVSMS